MAKEAAPRLVEIPNGANRNPATFRSNERDVVLRALKAHGVQIGVKEREVG